MSRRMLPILSIVLAGCSEAANNSMDTAKDTASVNRMESFRASDLSNPHVRHFVVNHKVQTLPAIHAEYVEEFIRVPNAFGVGRMPYRGPSTSPNWVELVPRSGGETAALKPTAPEYDEFGRILTDTNGTLTSVHEVYWLLNQRHLVSTSAEIPVVYIHDSPFLTATMHAQIAAKPVEGQAQAARAKRGLDPFETMAVDRLKQGDDLTVKTEPDEMKMVGAIRARAECLSCHKNAKVGDMLGAFTYTLIPISFATKPADCLKNKDGLAPETQAGVEALEALGGRFTRDDNGPVTGLSFADRPRENSFFVSPLRNNDLRWLANFPELQQLDLSLCRINDGCIAEIAQLKHLKKLSLISTAVSESGGKELKKALPGCEIIFQPQPVP